MRDGADAARTLQSKRKNYRGGRPKKLRRCTKCGTRLGAREMRIHKCPLRSK